MAAPLALQPMAPLVLQPLCGGCGAGGELFASQCTHLTLCLACGKAMAEKGDSCKQCGEPLTRLLKEFALRLNQPNRNFYVAKFLQGSPTFGKKSGTRWSMCREGAQGRNLSDAARERMKNKPWILEDDVGQSTFQGLLEGGQNASFFLLIMQGKDFVAMPTSAWYNFQKQLSYKTLSLEEAEEVMKNRRKQADMYKKWLTKGPDDGEDGGGEGGRGKGGGGGGGSRSKKGEVDDEFALDLSDREEDAEDDQERKNRLGMGKGQKGEGEEEEEAAPKEEVEPDEDAGDKGDDWEHEETFTDDDEAVGNDKEEREEEGGETPPPAIKEQEEEEEEGEEGTEEGGLSSSGKELKKLLFKTDREEQGEEEEEEEEDDNEGDDDEEPDLDIGFSPIFLGPQKVTVVKEEPGGISGTTKATPSGKAGGKRKAGGGAAAAEEGKQGASLKRVKTEEGSSVQVSPPKRAASGGGRGGGKGGISEEAVRAILRSGPIKSTDLVAKFKGFLKTPEDKKLFQEIMKKVGRMEKIDGVNMIVLR